MRYIQEIIRYVSFVGFGALAAYAYTCPCYFIYGCHMNQFWSWYLALGLLNGVNMIAHAVLI